MPRLGATAARPKSPPPDQPQLGEAVEPATEPAVEKPKRASTKPARERQADELGFAALDDTIDYLNVLMYGREGTAKTTSAAFAANVAGKGRVLVINAEGGLKKTALRRRGIDTSRIVTWPDPESGIRITNRTLERLHEKLLGDLTDDPGSWYAVIVDSVTDVHHALREQATDKRIDKLTNDPKVVDKSVIDEDFVDRDDYGVMTNQLRLLIRKFRDLPCHVIFTALERVDDSTKMVGPAVTPALATDLLGYVDVTMYLRATLHAPGEDSDDALAEFRALTRPGKSTRAKDRFDLLPRVLAEPRFDRVLGYIREELVESEDPIQVAYVQRREAEARAAAEAAAEKEAAKAARKTPAAKKAGRKTAPAATTTEGDDQ